MSLFEVEGWNVPSRIVSASSSSKKRKRNHPEDSSNHVGKNPKQLKTKQKSKAAKQSKPKNNQSTVYTNSKNAVTSPISTKPCDTEKNKTPKAGDEHVPMTDLQTSMKNSLEGARFRWINEMLYTESSAQSYELMQKDPNIFQTYHSGFRRQVLSWPHNPVQHFISTLSSSPRGTVIVDLGCGEAALAKSLIPKGLCVLSYDLVRLLPYVMEADICQWIPLPGCEDSAQGQVVDICVCALSLMNTNWVGCLRECWRILKSSGELKIAEVASRFTDINAFIKLVSEIGFKLKSKDQSNTHFILLEFKKHPRRPMDENQWLQLTTKHDVLKPCEYKRR